MKAREKQFLIGVAMTLAEIKRSHDQPTMVSNIMDGFGLELAAFEAAGVEEYDLAEIRQCLREAPLAA